MLHFQYIEYFIALAALPLMVLLYLQLVRWKKKTAKKIGDPLLIRELTSQYSPKKFLIKFILFGTAFTLCIIAVAGLVIPDGTQKINRRGTDLMIALDVSKSMMAQDIQPNRLERAKQVISKIIDNAPDDRIGLVVFAGRAYLQMPLTVDHEAAKMYLSAASVDDIPSQGTVISDALKMCYAAFNPKDKTFKSVLLISDGEDHDDQALKVTKDLAKQGIMLNTMGIGSPEGAPIMDPSTRQYKKDENGQTVITRLNEKEMKDIAADGNGIYQLYTNTDAVAANIEKQLNKISTVETTSDSSYESFKQYYQYFLGAAFVLLLVEFFYSEKRKVRIKKAIAVLAGLTISVSSYSQNTHSSLVKGNKAYKENNYNQAELEYRKALKNSGDNVTANYNLGNVLYRKKNTEEAVKSYDHVIADAKENATRQKAYYNKGVAFQKAKKLPECISAYKNALLLDPADEDARQNLQRALKEQQQQQKQQKKNQQQKQKQHKQDKQQQQPQKPESKKTQPAPSKISRQDAEEKLKALLQNEKELQDKLHKIKGAPVTDTHQKDW